MSGKKHPVVTKKINLFLARRFIFMVICDMNSGGLRVAHSGSGAKASPLAARPLMADHLLLLLAGKSSLYTVHNVCGLACILGEQVPTIKSPSLPRIIAPGGLVPPTIVGKAPLDHLLVADHRPSHQIDRDLTHTLTCTVPQQRTTRQ